jgi:hypothetical protein
MRPVINGYLTEQHLVDYFSAKPNVVCNKAYFSGHRFRPDIILLDDRIIIEIDGYRHYTDPSIAIKDEERDCITSDLGFKTIRIPYWLQMTEKLWEVYGLDIKKYNDLPIFNYLSGFIDTTVFPAHFCQLGLERFHRENSFLISSDSAIHCVHASGSLAWQLFRHHPFALLNPEDWDEPDESDEVCGYSMNLGLNLKLNEIALTVPKSKLHDCLDGNGINSDYWLALSGVYGNLKSDMIPASMLVMDNLIASNRTCLVDDFTEQEILVLGKFSGMDDKETKKAFDLVSNSHDVQLFASAKLKCGIREE